MYCKYFTEANVSSRHLEYRSDSSKRLGDAVPLKKIEVASPLYVSILLLFSFHLSGNKFLYTFMSVFGGSFAALLITSVIYSKVFIPCILHEQASE
jgi:hypothetical protein